MSLKDLLVKDLTHAGEVFMEQLHAPEAYRCMIKLCFFSTAVWFGSMAYLGQHVVLYERAAYDLAFQTEKAYDKDFDEIVCQRSDEHYVLCSNAKHQMGTITSGTDAASSVMTASSKVAMVSGTIGLWLYFLSPHGLRARKQREKECADRG